MRDGYLVDTNLLLVMIIGGVEGGRYMSRSKRLGRYSHYDCQELWRKVGGRKVAWITPYIATEVSNLIDLDGDAGFKAFAVAREVFLNFKQIDSNLSLDSNGWAFKKYGLTDNSLINLSREYRVLTNDQRMFYFMTESNPNGVELYVPLAER